MDDGGTGSSIAWFVVLLLLEIMFYGFSSAMQNSKGLEPEDSEKEPEGGQTKRQLRLAYLAAHHAQYANAVQLGVVTINTLFGAMHLSHLSSYFGRIVYRMAVHNLGSFTSWQLEFFLVLTAILVTVGLLYILVTFGIVIPKRIAARNPDKWIQCLATPFYYYVRIIAPFTALISVTAKCLLRVFGIKDADSKSDVTEEEILSMVNVGHEQGILHASEAEMITNIFEYGDKEAKDIMINRNNLVAIDCSVTLQEAAAFIANANNSRFPVYDGTIDHIVGILHLKDVMRLQMNEKMKNKPIGKIKGLLRDPVFITEKRKIDDLFRVMQSKKIQMVIVIDEYGQTAGLVALEDILEEIVGDIEDEYDEEASYISKSSADTYIIKGMMPLEELAEQLKISFADEPFDTVNGFVISRLEHIPEEKEDFTFEYEGYTFRILEVKDRMIQSVLAEKTSPGEEADEEKPDAGEVEPQKKK